MRVILTAKPVKTVERCPVCGNNTFLVSKGIRYCAPNFDEKQGCGWSGPRSELFIFGKTRRDQNILEFNEKYEHDCGDAHLAFYNIAGNRGWFQGTWNIPKQEAIDRLIKEGKLREKKK